MPSTVPWRFWGDGTLGLGLGCWAAAIGAAARHVANVRRLREGIWFTAIPRWFGAGIAYSMPCSGRGGRGQAVAVGGADPLVRGRRLRRPAHVWQGADIVVPAAGRGRPSPEGTPGPGGPPHHFRRIPNRRLKAGCSHDWLPHKIVAQCPDR